MASPHAVASPRSWSPSTARRDGEHGGLKLDPAKTESIMRRAGHGHPVPGAAPVRLSAAAQHRAVHRVHTMGTPDRNGFYGDGIVNAAAVGADGR